MFEVLLSVRDPGTCDLLRAAFAERGVFRAAAAPREKLDDLLRPPAAVDVVVVDVDPKSRDDREFLTSLRTLARDVAIVGVGPLDGGAASRLSLDVRTFIRAPIDPFDLARRLKRLADHLGATA
jgi:CheY-like chemotaxis protein